MFILLSRILLWLLVLTIIWYVLTQFIPRPYLTWLGGIILLLFVVLAFNQPNDPTVAAVWSLLSFPLKPLGLAILLFLSSLKAGLGKTDGKLVLAGLLVLFLASMPIVAFWLAQQTGQIGLNATATFQPNVAQAPVRAIVIMGNGPNPVDSLLQGQSQLSGASANLTNVQPPQLILAAEIYRARVAEIPNLIVIVSVDAQANLEQAVQDPAVEEVRASLINAGVPGERVFIAPVGSDAGESARNVAEVLDGQGFPRGSTSVILVAPAISVGRLAATLRQQGVQVLPEPINAFTFQLRDGRELLENLTLFVPTANALALTTKVVEELLTSVYYFLWGWI